MTSNLPIGMALIGCGNIGTLGHAPAYVSAVGVSLLAVSDLDPSRAENVSAITGAATRGLEEILADPAIEAVDVAVPTEEHERVSNLALSAGKHVLVEKPITTSLEAAHRLMVQAAQQNLTLMVGHVRRFDPRYLAIAEELAAGSVGTPRYMRRAERQWLPFSGDAWSWSGPGGGVLMDVGVHVADLVRWLLGEPTVVYATTRHIRPEAREWGDHVFVTFGLGDSVTAVGEASWAHPQSFATFYGSLEIVGSDGILNLRDAEGPLLIIGPDGVEHPRFGPLLSTIPSAFSAQLEHFASVVAGEIEPHQTASDATRSLLACLAAAESIETGSPVSLTGS
jgi:predicted dehydrogenase